MEIHVLLHLFVTKAFRTNKKKKNIIQTNDVLRIVSSLRKWFKTTIKRFSTTSNNKQNLQYYYVPVKCLY